MMRFLVCILFVLDMTNLFGQNNLQKVCSELVYESFVDTFDWAEIQIKSNGFHEYLMKSAPFEFHSCNCADSLWISLWGDRRFDRSFNFPYDYKDYLRNLVSTVDAYNLDYEFNLMKSKTLTDSFYYVMDRLKRKLQRKDLNESKGQYFYWCFDPEADFLGKNKNELQDKYLEVFDDINEDARIRDFMLAVLFDSNIAIEQKILSRIDKIDNTAYFHRFTGILATSGSTASVIYYTNYLRDHQLELNEIKMILQSINRIIERTKVKRNARNDYRSYLEESQLDTLTEYELFIRDF